VKTSVQPRLPRGLGQPRGQPGIPSLQGPGHPSSLPVSLLRLLPASLPSVIQADVSRPGEVAAVPPPAGQSQPAGVGDCPALSHHRELVASAPRHPYGAGEQRTGDRDRGAQSTRGASLEPGQGRAAASSFQCLLTRAVWSWRKVCSWHPHWQAGGWSPTCPGAVSGTEKSRTPA